MSEESIKLKVAEAIQDDVNKGIVRIDSSYMHQIGVRPGDVVQITGKRTTVGIADRAYPGDIGLNIIRLDGLLRRNAQTSIGEMVEVTKPEVQEAKRIVISPARKGVMIRANPIIFKQGLLGRAVIKGDVVSLGGTRKRRSAMSGSPFFDEVFNMLDENMINFGLGDLRFIVATTDPKGVLIITENTEVEFNPEAVDVEEKSLPEVTYEDIGGLEEEIKKVREMVELPLRYPEVFERLGIEPPKGVLLHGPPGTGKTLLAKAVASETNSNFILINGPEIMSKFYGQSEENLRKKFEEAEKNAPSIIFIDEIDAIASKREESRGEVERRVVAQLLAIMDGLKSRGKVIVIAATNIPNQLDPALRRPGRFDREMEIGVPSKEGRLNILKIHSRNMPLAAYKSELFVDVLRQYTNKQQKEGAAGKPLPEMLVNAEELRILQEELLVAEPKLEAMNERDRYNQFIAIAKQEVKEQYAKALQEVGATAFRWIDEEVRKQSREDMLEQVADITHGFVGADLAALTRESAMIILRKILPELNLKEGQSIPEEILDRLRITHGDMTEALKSVRPSALREVLIEVPSITWEDIGGLEKLKQELREMVEWPLKSKEVFSRLGVKPPKGVLLYGPPGTGKTLLAKAVANESDANFILVKGPELLSKWVGESEKAIRKIFEKARQTSPCIIFFDEIDAIAPRRGMGDENNVTERVVNQILTEMDGVQDLVDVVIIAATNRPDIIDTALLRPGRFDRIVYAPVPSAEARYKILQVHAKSVPLDPQTIPENYNPTTKVELESQRDKFLYYLAEKTEGYVGADIEALVREAAILAIRADKDTERISIQSFEEALEKVKPSVSKEIEKAYEELQNDFRKARAEEIKNKPSYYG